MSSESHGEVSLFPLVYANEQETSVTITRTVEAPDPDLPDFMITERVHNEPEVVSDFRPAELDVGFEFLLNGFRMYDGMHAQDCGESDQKIELSSPECLSPRELTRVMRAGELILQRGVEEYIDSHRGFDTEVDAVRIQRRVIDSYGNTWACHDNFGMSAELLRALDDRDFDTFLIGHLTTRHFVSGAGRLDVSGAYHYAQKPLNIDNIVTDGFNARYYRTLSSSDSEHLMRLEVGSSDVNMSDWAAHMRVASVGLLTAVVATGRGHLLAPHLPDIDLDRETETIRFGRQANDVYLQETALRVMKKQLGMIDFQQALANTYLERVAAEAPAEYAQAARELYAFCDDFRAVARGEKLLTALADRADWAAKLYIILRNMDKDKEAGGKRTLGDFESLRDDLKYDHLRITPRQDRGFFYDKGDGYKLRDRGFFRGTVAQADAEPYYRTPPRSRAMARVALLALGDNVTGVSWNAVTAKRTQSTIIIVPMPNAQSLEMPQEGKVIIDRVQPKLHD